MCTCGKAAVCNTLCSLLGLHCVGHWIYGCTVFFSARYFIHPFCQDF